MRHRHRRPVQPVLLLSILSLALHAPPALASISLTQFQQISGFSPECTEAYLTPLESCQTSDFSPPNVPCSEICFENLINITSTINAACKGITANPTTLIGLFFEGEGAQALCPTILSTNGTLPPGPSIINDPPAASTAPNPVSETFLMTSTQGAAPTNTGSSSVAPVQPMSTSDGSSSGSSSVTGVVAGTQTVAVGTQTAAAATDGPGTFGGGALPFTANSSASIASPLAMLYLGIASALCELLVAFAW